MPLYIGDYLADTARLTTAQHGAYLLLIMDYWRNGPPPDDDAVLAQITRMSAAEWRKSRPVLENFFKIFENKWVHDRIEKEKEIVTGKKAVASAKAKTAAEKRWSSTNDDSLIDDAPSNAQAVPESCPSQSQSETRSKPHVVCEQTPHDEIIDLYHETLPMCPRVRKWTPARMQAMRARWRENPDLEYWRNFFVYVAESDFLTGKSDRRQGSTGPPFLADLEWLINSSNHTKTVEGKYHRE